MYSCNTQGGPIKSKPLLNYHKSYWKPANKAKIFISYLSVNEALEYFQLVLNILCVTKFVTSSIIVLQAFLCEKLSAYDQIEIKKSEKDKKWISNKFVNKYPSKIWFTNGIRSSILGNDARGSVYSIYTLWYIAQTRLTNNNSRQKLSHT